MSGVLALLLRLTISQPGSPQLAIHTLSILLIAIAPFILRASGSLYASGLFIVVIANSALTATAFVTGGLASPILALAPLMPVMAAFLLGRRAALILGGILGLALLAFTWLHIASTSADPELLLRRGLSLALALTLGSFLAVLYEELRLRAEEERQRSEHLYGRLFEQSKDAVVLSTPAGHLVDINPAGVELFGQPSRDHVLAQRLRDLHVPPDQRESTLDRLRLQGFVEGYEFSYRTPENALKILEGTTSAVLDDQGRIESYLSILRDVTERKKIEQRLVLMARFDPVTGLPNRFTLRNEIERSIARTARFGRRMAVMLLEVNGLKEQHLELEEEAYQALCQAVANRLKQDIRKVDTLARLDDSQFAVVKTDFDDPEHAARLARRLVDTFDEPFEVADHTFQFEASLGISIFPPGPKQPDSLLKEAETAFHRSRADSPRGFQFYDEDIGHEIEVRTALANDLHQALDRGELRLEYQPQVDLAEQRILSVEALVRWDHPEHGALAPAQFLPIAESIGKMSAIDEWVLSTACSQVETWQSLQLTPLPLAVNLSPVQLKNPHLVDEVVHVLRSTGLEAGCLELEVSEAFLNEAPHAVARNLQALRDTGVRLTLDDFGTGRASLEFLSQLPLDKLKIDASVVQRITTGERERDLAGAVISLGEHLGLQVLAEGVETEEQMDYLVHHGCFEAQGFFFCEPLPPEAMEELLVAGSVRVRTGLTPSLS